MKIPAISNFYKIYNCNKNNQNLNLNEIRYYGLQHDTVSFSSWGNDDKPIYEQVFELPEDAFPSVELRKFVIQEIEADHNINLLDLHKAYYSQLWDCESLEDAKREYPEFKNVVDVSGTDVSSLRPQSVLSRINNGEIKGLSLANLSLEVLKMYYAKLMGPAEIAQDLNLGGSGYTNLMKKLNITMDKRYIKLLTAYKHSIATSKLWQNPSHRANISEKASKRVKEEWKNPEYRNLRVQKGREQWTPEMKAKQAEIMAERMAKLKENPDYPSILAQRAREFWDVPENRRMQSERVTKYWQEHPEYRDRHAIVYAARTEAWNRHPEIAEVYRDVLKSFPASMNKMLYKKRLGFDLTEEENKYVCAYYKKCHELCPNDMKIIGQTQKEVLQEWGFYDEAENIKEETD